MSPQSNTSKNQKRLAVRNANLRPPLIQRNVTPRAEQPSSNILAEINNASLRRRQHQQQAVSDAFLIYQDRQSSTKHGAVPDGLSNDKENQVSPECLTLSTPSPVPPITSHLNVPRTRSPKSPKSRSTSGTYRNHIEHLEAQLAAAHGQLEDFSSPKTRKAHWAKRRALSQECELLRQELSDVEERCQRRIDDEAEEYKSCIRRLERDLEVSEQKRIEADYEMEETKKTLTSVQASHMELERRLDSWSGLLARSPTKVEASTPSPAKSRPKSMLPRIPTSRNLREESPTNESTSFMPASPVRLPSPMKPASPAKQPSPMKHSSPTREAFLQRPMLPRKQILDSSPWSSTHESPLEHTGPISIRRRRQLKIETAKDENEDGVEETTVADQCLSDELGILGLGDVFTKHSQTTTSTPSVPSPDLSTPSTESPPCSPSSPLAYKSDVPLSKPARVMRRFVNTGEVKPLVLSATLKQDQRVIDESEPRPSILIRCLSHLSSRALEACSAPLVAARWCLALFLLGPLAWRRVLAGPSMIYGS